MYGNIEINGKIIRSTNFFILNVFGNDFILDNQDEHFIFQNALRRKSHIQTAQALLNGS